MPATSQVFTRDKMLTDLALNYGRNEYAAEFVFPSLPVVEKTSKILTVDPNNQRIRKFDTVRAPGTLPNTVDFSLTRPVFYDCVDHSLMSTIPFEHQSATNPEAYFATATKRAEFIRDNLDTEREVDCVAKITANVTGSNTSSPSDKWDDDTAGKVDAIKQIVDAKAVVRRTGLVNPTYAVTTEEVLDAILQNPLVRERYQGVMAPSESTQTREARARLLAALCGLDEVRIVGVSYQAESNGAEQEDPTLTSIWGNNFLLFHKEAPSLEYTGFGLNMRWRLAVTPEYAAMGAQAQDTRIIVVKACTDTMATMVASHDYYDQKALRGDAAYWFTNVLTA